MSFKSSSLFVISMLTASAVLTTVSCKKSNSGNSSSGQVTATISGTAWSNNVSTQGLYSTNAGEFEIVGAFYKSGDSTGLGISFLTPFPLNTPINSDTAGVDVAYVNAETQAEYDGGLIAGHSLLTVTSWDSTTHNIRGTFSGVLYNISGGSDSLVVTNGSFNSSYTEQ